MEGIEKVLVLYTEKKRPRQLLDFDDLLSAWLRLMMEHADVREMLAGQFQHILVDEYQDTNAIQGMIVDLLASKHRNLTVVGDDSQSIYSFRGANFENIITFKRALPRCPGVQARDELPLRAGDPDAGQRQHRPEQPAAAEEPQGDPVLGPQARDRGLPGPLHAVAVHRGVRAAPARPGPDA